MGMTMTQKILAAHAGLPSVEAGQLIEADLDLALEMILLPRLPFMRWTSLKKRKIWKGIRSHW